jgi:hypothetical protein
MAYGSGNFVYTDSTHVGTLKQTTANMAVAPVAKRWYKFVYDISSSTGSCTATISTSFAKTATALDLTNGTAKVAYVFSAVSPSDFIISVTSTSGGFTIDNVSLKAITEASGNYTVASRNIAVADSTRIAVVSA